MVSVPILIFAVRPTDLILDQTIVKLSFQRPPQMEQPGFSHFYIETKSHESADWKKEIPGES